MFARIESRGQLRAYVKRILLVCLHIIIIIIIVISIIAIGEGLWSMTLLPNAEPVL